MTKMIKTVKNQITTTKSRRAERTQLRRDLAAYATPNEIDDLLAAFARDESPAADEVRSLLHENRKHASNSRFAA
jgi:hypothetical protein